MKIPFGVFREGFLEFFFRGGLLYAPTDGRRIEQNKLFSGPKQTANYSILLYSCDVCVAINQQFALFRARNPFLINTRQTRRYVVHCEMWCGIIFIFTFFIVPGRRRFIIFFHFSPIILFVLGSEIVSPRICQISNGKNRVSHTFITTAMMGVWFRCLKYLGKTVTVQWKYCNRCINGVVVYLRFCANTIITYYILYPWQYFKRIEKGDFLQTKEKPLKMLLTFKWLCNEIISYDSYIIIKINCSLMSLHGDGCLWVIIIIIVVLFIIV